MRYVTFFTLVCVILTFQFLPAQAPDTLWTRTYGGTESDVGACVNQTFDGGFIIVGSTQSYGAGDNDIWLIKTNVFGDTLWTKTFGGSSYDVGNFVEQTADSGYIICGYTYSFGLGNADIWLIKIDIMGDTLWTKTYGGINQDVGGAVQQTIDGGYILTGSTRSFGSGVDDVWILKTDESGDTLWSKIYGGSSYEWGYSIQQTADSGYIIAGSTASFGAGEDDVWLIKTNALGDTLWTRTYGGMKNDEGYSVKQTIDKGYVITGRTNGSGLMCEAWLIKTNSSGDTVWTKTFSRGYRDVGYSIEQTSDSGYIVTGNSNSYSHGDSVDVWVMKTDQNANCIWSKFIGDIYHDSGHSVKRTTDGGYIICGYSEKINTNNADIWLIKIAPDLSNVNFNDHNYSLKKFTLNQNYPNPFNPSTTIEFDLPMSSEVTLKIFNILGEEVVTLVSDRLSAGTYSSNWDASNLASGVYLYRLQAGDYVETRKMVLMR